MKNARQTNSQKRNVSKLLIASVLWTFFFLFPGSFLAAHAAPEKIQGTLTPYSLEEIVERGERLFGNVTRQLAEIIQRNAAAKWGLPNGYVIGSEGSVAFFGGLRYGEGVLYTKAGAGRRVFWQGASVGFDFGGDGGKTMILVYNLPNENAIFSYFTGLSGSAYVIGGLGLTALSDLSRRTIVAPIRSGGGVRLGINVGYLKFTPQNTISPF